MTTPCHLNSGCTSSVDGTRCGTCKCIIHESIGAPTIYQCNGFPLPTETMAKNVAGGDIPLVSCAEIISS
jgi:hypothetical protein